jgi:hypothetical protein
MTRQDVEAALGPAFAAEPEPSLGETRVVMTYTRPPALAYSYPMLWVHLEGGRVIEVYAKRYVWWGIDNTGIYLLSKDVQRPETSGLVEAFGQ